MKINAFSFSLMMQLLMDGTYNCKELSEETGLHYVTVLDYCRQLHKHKVIHIAAWEKDSRGRDIKKVYKLGKGRDAKREAMTHAERQKRCRERKKLLDGGVVSGKV